MRKDGAEGWAPENYLELVPPKAEPVAPPPPPRSAAPKAPLAPMAANASAKPVAVFPGVVANGASSAPTWKKNNTTTAGATAAKPAPAVASKPKPPVVAKPGVVGTKPPVKPPVPAAARPAGATPPPKAGGLSKPAAPAGQLDLAAAVSSISISALQSMLTIT